MIKRSFSPKEKALLFFLCIILVCFAYYMLVHRNVTNSLTEIEAQRSNLETEIQVGQAKVQKMETMQKELKQLESQGYRSTVPDYDNLSKEITFLNGLLDRTSDYTINFAGTTTTENIVRRSIDLDFISGSYNECCQIIEKLQNCKYCCRVGSIAMTPIREYNSVYASLYGYTYDADYSILHNPLQVTVSVTFFEKVVEEK